MSDHRKDLFGHPLTPATSFRKDGKLRKVGYAARPGSGPKGQRCNTCRFCVNVVHRQVSSRKCEVVAGRWTYGAETDIKHNAPACSEWQRKEYRKKEFMP